MKLALATIGAIGLASTAHAASTVQFDTLAARFINPVGGNVLAIDGAATDPAYISWGQNSRTPQPGGNSSGYEFDARDAPFAETQDTPFLLGSFTHFNNVIQTGTSISAVQLEIIADISAGLAGDPLTSFGTRSFLFDITHNETPNSADPCGSSVPDPLDPVNVFGCADEVSLSIAQGSQSFTLGDTMLILDIFGFAETEADATNGTFSPTFLSPEGGTNLRYLSAGFVEDVRTFSDVPLPASAWLLFAGVAGIAGLRKARKAA